MKVIVKLANAKFFDGSNYFTPEVGDEIELPDSIAEAELAAGYVATLSDMAEGMKGGRKKKASVPAPEPEPPEDEEEEEDDEEEEEEEEEVEEVKEKRPPRKRAARKSAKKK